MESSLTILKSLAKSLKTVSPQEREKIISAIQNIEKEMEEQAFIMKRLERDKSIIVNILQSTIADLEKSKRKIEESNDQLIKHQTKLNQQKKIIEEKSFELKENLKKLEHSYTELEDFTHVASHDLKSPLRSISGFAYLLQKKYLDQIDNEANRYLEFIVSSAAHMHEVIEALLKYSRVGKNQEQFEEIDLNKVLEITLDNLSNEIYESGATVRYPILPTITGDKISLVQLFQNLISNSIKFRSENKPQITIQFEKKSGHYQFEVQDNGVGIDEHFTKKVFSPFQRLEERKQPGLGLGLAICKKVVSVHEGSIRFENNLNGGTTFIFQLPIAIRKPIEVEDH